MVDKSMFVGGTDEDLQNAKITQVQEKFSGQTS